MEMQMCIQLYIIYILDSGNFAVFRNELVKLKTIKRATLCNFKSMSISGDQLKIGLLLMVQTFWEYNLFLYKYATYVKYWWIF